MFEKSLFRCVAALATLMLLMGTAGAVTIDLVPVGNPGNAGELSGEGAGGYGPDAIVGGVDYPYWIGKYEVTNAQYTEFLNAVAATDTYGLYSGSMWSSDYGCKIQQSGSSGSYSYSVAADRANRPVNYVSWGDATRFANWLHNGQPSGPQDNSTTEDGAYFLNGATSDSALMAITRESDARWFIPTEDEWYKAAYHKNDGVTGNYFDYPTASDLVPSNDLLTPDGGNNANFSDNGYTIGSPYYTTAVGEFENSASPYGTFDQGGNLLEWNETEIYAGLFRGLRGGGWSQYSYHLHASRRYDVIRAAFPADESSDVGFRVASVPEPGSITLLLCGAVTAWIWWRRRR